MAQQRGPRKKSGVSGPTLMDVARAAGVSIASASRAITGSEVVREDLREHILAVAKELRYIPHLGARSLASSHTNMIGLLLPDIYGDFITEYIRGANDAASETKVHLIISGGHRKLEEAISAAHSMSGRVDGIIAFLPVVEVGTLLSSLPSNLPAVIINSRSDSYHNSIGVNNFEGAREAVSHLISQGCRSIVHVAGPMRSHDAQERSRGYLLGMEAAGLPSRVISGDFSEKSGAQAIQGLLDDGTLFDGIFAANDLMAIGALRRLEEVRRKVPDEVAIVGFDDTLAARLIKPSLTSLRIDGYELGRKSIRMLTQVVRNQPVNDAEAGFFAPSLMVRASSLRAK